MQLYEKTYKLSKTKLGPDHPDTLDAMNHLGMLYGREGNFAAAGAIIEQRGPRTPVTAAR